MIRVGIVGATGYTGLELCKLCYLHPEVAITHVFSKQHVGKTVYPFLRDIPPYEAFDPASPPLDVDVLFLALPHGQSHAFLAGLAQNPFKIIDLSADFRLTDPALFEKYYGVRHEGAHLLSEVPLGFTELFRKKIAKSQVCANPGCYSTGSVFGLHPLANYIKSPVVVDAKSGVSGAGKALKESSLFCEANEGLSAYGTGAHRHTPEIEQATGVSVLFSPHLVPMNRGILATIYIDNTENLSHENLVDIYQAAYGNEPFIQVMPDLATPSTKYVSGSNNCLISFKVIEKQKKIVIFAAIDNLLKGASGQAVQNMNCMFGLDETMGLKQLPNYV